MTNTVYTIEKNVPLLAQTKPRPLKYPYDDMEVGDSFLIPWLEDTKEGRTRAFHKAQSAHGYTARHKNDEKYRTFSIRRDDAGGGYRVWRRT